MDLKSIYWFLLGILVSLAEGSLTTEGTRFIMYFTEGNQQVFPPIPLNIYISTRSQAAVTVNIRSPIWNSANSINQTLQVTSASPKVVPIPAALRSAQIGRESKAILMEASDNISVFGLNPSQNQAGLFSVLPTSSLGTEYIFPSFTQFNIPSQGFIGIVTEHDQTKMKVYLPQSSHKSMATVGIISYAPGETIQGTLNRYEITEIRQDTKCPTCDLSGSRIIASKPIAVFSTISLSSPLITNKGGDLLVEQLVPTSLWGRTYITMTSPDNALGTVVRVMSAEPNVTVYQSDLKTFVLEEPSKFKDILLQGGKHLMLQGSKKLQVIQYSSSAPFMLLVTALEHYSHRAHVPTAAIDTASKLSQNHKIVVMARVCDAAHITVNGTLISDLVPWRSMGATGFAVADIPATYPSSFHLLEGQNGYDVSFGGYVYGQGDITAYAAPLAMEGNQIVEPMLWAEPLSVNIHKANQESTDGIMQQAWRLVDRDITFSSPVIKSLTVMSTLVCFHQCMHLKNCKYVSITKGSKGKQACQLFNERMTCGNRTPMSGARIYTSRIIDAV